MTDMKRTLSFLALMLFSSIVFAQADSLRHRVFLVGDAGYLSGGKHPVVDWLKKNVNWNDPRNTVVYLGDNVYPDGLPVEGEAGYEQGKAALDYQIGLVKGSRAKAFFIPGNHDWKVGKIGGWQRAVNQVDYINSLQLSNVQAWPLNGCPGPVLVEVDSSVILVMMDSQWFLHAHDKPGPASGCSSKTLDQFAVELNEIAKTHPDQLLLLAMHHPIYTVGAHGGAYTLRHHIFPLAEAVNGLYIPLPIIGSIYPIARGIFGNIQDVNHPVYRAMSNTLLEALKDHPNVVVASGHDHSLQLLQKDDITHIVSGSGSKITRIQKRNNDDLIFAHVNYGFATLEISKSGKVETKFYDITSGNITSPLFTKELKTIVKTTPVATVDTLLPQWGNVTIAANPNLEGSGLKNLFFGKNYRNEWTEKITVPILDIGNEQGGLKPERKGGGKQTRSLRLVQKDGKEWVLRSIEKYPEAAIPADLRQTVAKDIVEQGISASYPFGALSISPMSEALGLPQIRRKLVFVPDDPRLERFRGDFRNILAMLEEREPANVKKTDNTDELILKLAKDNDDHVDQFRVLKARLLDNFIMDFDRHEDQWRWATYDTGKGKVYYPIPRDHDQAFFTNQGILPFFLRRPWLVPEIQGFRPEARNIRTFNKPARNFDRFFLTELNAEDWNKQIDTFLAKMTDEVIEESLNRQPAEIRKYAAANIVNTLKERRKYFRDDMMRYYRFISKQVSVVGSNQREQFTIRKNENGTVQVTVNKIDKNNNVVSITYDRLFDPAITEELRLYGLSDNDRFVIEGGHTPIKIRIIGGPGDDQFINNGTGGKVMLYDALYEENQVTGNQNGIDNKFSNDPEVNRYDRLNFKYDLLIPALNVAYNTDDGIYLGAQLELITQGFRKEPYGMRHFIAGNRALKTSSYRFRYEGEFIKALGHHDIMLNADLRAPINVTNFFGLGNETVFDKNQPEKEKYYRVRYDYFSGSALLRRQMQSWLKIYYGGTYQRFQVEEDENSGKYVSETLNNGLDPATLYEPKSFAGPMFKLGIDSRNNEALPTRGFLMDLNVRQLFGLNNLSNNVTQLDVDMRVYASIFKLPRLVLASRLGFGVNYGDFEFPQAYKLGGTENLRGYRRDRFAGKSALYNNTEIRFRIADFNTYLFPGSIGIHLFNDVGRVWHKGESSEDWHVGNGGGIWIAPVRRVVVTASITRSKEEKALPLVTFGFQF